MVTRRDLLVLLPALGLASTARAQSKPPAQPRVAGKIALAEGLARVEGKDQRMRQPAVGENVLEGDTITTLSSSEVHLNMTDGASFIVRERTRVRITEYIADGGDKDRSLMDLAEGALRAITGWIGAYNRSNYRVRTPLVTIGVRGTDHEPTHLLENDPRGQPGSYDKVNEGRAFMESKSGTVEVPANSAAFQALSAGSIPQLLATIPSFFKPGSYEAEFVRQALKLKDAIPQMRLDRIDTLRNQGLLPKEAEKALNQVKPLEDLGKDLLRRLR
jgi:hypothetical protein